MLPQSAQCSPMLPLFSSANDVLYRKGRLTSSCTFILSGNIGYYYTTTNNPSNPTSPGKRTELELERVLENSAIIVEGDGGNVIERQGSTQGSSRGLGQGQGHGLGMNNDLISPPPQEVVTLEPWSIVAADTLLESDGAFLPDHTYFITR